jgi:hypothetical protein
MYYNVEMWRIRIWGFQRQNKTQTYKVKFVLVQALKAYRRSTGLSPLIFNLVTGMRWVVNVTTKSL